MIRKIAGVFVFSVLFACGEADRVPRDVISKEKMGAILMDMNLAEVYGREQMDTVRIADSLRENNVKQYYVQVLQIHDVSREAFQHSYKYYETHPNKLAEVYTIMTDLVNRRKITLDSLAKIEAWNSTNHDPVKKDTLFWPNKDIRKMILP